jgi:iron complex transport system substrate-binding protein
MAGPVEAPLQAAWLARLLHPEGRWETSLREEIASTYREVYSYTFTARDFDTMLHPRDNAGAAGFERLLDGAPIQTGETKGEDRGTALAY